MLYYDVGLSAWVRQPGSTSQPWIVPVLTVGATHAISVTFCDLFEIQDFSAATWFLGIKQDGDFSGSYIASNDAPTIDGEGAVTFVIDLDTDDAKAYFVTSPTADTLECALQIVWDDDEKRVTTPLKVLLQNTYLKDQ